MLAATKDRITSKSYSFKNSQIEEISKVSIFKKYKSDSALMREVWETYKALNSDLVKKAIEEISLEEGGN